MALVGADPELVSVAEAPKKTPLDATARVPLMPPTSQYPTTLHTSNVGTAQTVSVGSELTDKEDSDTEIYTSRTHTIKKNWRRLSPRMRRAFISLVVLEVVLCISFVVMASIYGTSTHSNTCEENRDQCYAQITEILKHQHAAADGLSVPVHIQS